MFMENIIYKKGFKILSGPVGNPESSRLQKRSSKKQSYKFLGLSLFTHCRLSLARSKLLHALVIMKHQTKRLEGQRLDSAS